MSIMYGRLAHRDGEHRYSFRIGGGCVEARDISDTRFEVANGEQAQCPDCPDSVLSAGSRPSLIERERLQTLECRECGSLFSPAEPMLREDSCSPARVIYIPPERTTGPCQAEQEQD